MKLKALIIVVSLLIALELVLAEKVEILIPNGKIIGEHFLSEDGHEINRFLGIPYAEPPIDELRFKKTAPKNKWTEPIEALKWPPNCLQPIQLRTTVDYTTILRNYSQEMSEDCLYLNVWSPNVNALNENNLRPVMFWIHGGGLKVGGSSSLVNDMETISTMMDAVMVSFNYRLGPLGYFYSEKIEEIKGNQGFWDQATALKWVNENIRYFGGDPKRITIAGLSAGSWSVSLHILSPITRDLFQNAIMMSGAATKGLVKTPENALQKEMLMIKSLGCANEQDESVTKETVECLNKLDWKDMINKINPSGLETNVIIDGEFLPDLPDLMLLNGNHKKNFNILVDTVENEGGFWFKLFFPSFDNDSSMHLNDVRDALKKSIQTITDDKISFDLDLISRFYYNGFDDNFDDSELFKKQTSIAFGDLILTCPTLSFVRNIFSSSPSTINVYQWFYKAKIGKTIPWCHKFDGACHGGDSWPFFGIPFSQHSQHHDREREISREVIDFVNSFIRTG
ncbi:Acetylcholinesterase-like protein [Sarcoptes scabiei]|nr:Acetylcholinesterase-like protein [Sarcoptes scabiei]